MYRSNPLRSTLNPGYITGLDMCKVCTEAVHSVALWTRVTLQVWTCVKYVPKQSIAQRFEHVCKCKRMSSSPPHPTPPHPIPCDVCFYSGWKKCVLWLQSVCAGDSGKWLCAHVTPVCVCGWMWVEKMMQNCACVYLWLQSVCAGNPLTIPQPDLLGTQSEQFFHSGEDSEMVGRCWKMFLRPFEKLQSCQVFFFAVCFGWDVHWFSCSLGTIHRGLLHITPLPRYESPLTIEAVASVLYCFTLLKPIINPSLPLLPTRCNFQFCKALLATVAHERFRFRLESPSAHVMSSWWSLAGKRPHPRCIYPSNPRWMSKRMFILRA